MRYHSNRLGFLVGITVLIAACGDTNTGPVGAPADDTEVASFESKSKEAPATVAWNQTARELITLRSAPGPTVQLRILAYLTLAQYNAVVTAEDAKYRGRRASPAGAVAGASVVVLKNFFPLDSAVIDAKLEEARAAAESGDKNHGQENVRFSTRHRGRHERSDGDFAAGELVGRAVGAAVVSYAATDNFNLLPLPPVPTGPGYWFSATPAAKALWGTRPFFLTSADQFRPPPPPAFGSPAYLTDLTEIRMLSDTRTPDQLAIAQIWATRAAIFMNEVGTRDDRGTQAEVSARLHTSWPWRIWPPSTPTSAAGTRSSRTGSSARRWPTRLSPFPSACPTTRRTSAVTPATPRPTPRCSRRPFPRRRALLDGYITEAGLSRMYGGLHYRFDITAGQQLGRDVARWAMKHDVVGHRPFPLD